MGGATYQKMLIKGRNDRKRKLLTELAISLNEIREELSPWVEIVGDKKYIFKRVQNVASFGVLHLEFEEENNPENKVRLPLHLGLDK